MGQLTGKATIKVNGKVLNSMPNATIDIGGPVRTAQNGSTKHLGFYESIKESVVTVPIAVDADTSLDEIRHWRNVTCVFEADTGQRYLVKDAANQNPPVLTGGEGGNVQITLFGPPAEEL